MAQWRNTDDAANSVLWAAALVNKPANSANRTALFGNTTADAFVTGATVGTFAVSEAEMRAARAGKVASKPAHSGYVIRKTGSGGRAGRVQTEVLVAMNSITGDAENTAFLDLSAVIVTQPSSVSANATANERGTFTVAAATVPTGGSLSYIWQKWNGSAFANLSNAGAYSNTTTVALSVLANTATTGEIYRAYVYGAGINPVNSSNAVFTITT
jgi:hypothetical protein